MNDRTLPTEDAETAIGVDDRGGMAYASAATSGHTEVVLPALPGSPNGETRMLAKDFGPIVLGKIESSMNRQGYLKSGPQQSAAETLAHYVAVAKGSKLMQPEAISHLERLAKEFAAEKEEDRQMYWEMTIRPALLSLTPKRRQP